MNSQYLKQHKLPDSPGVYFFVNKQKKILYIGKATSLNDRVKSYFASDLIQTRGPLIVRMVEEADKIEFRKTASVLEALLLEADLIKKFKPKFNTKEKDDKSFLCVVITKEDFPEVLTIRKKDIVDDSRREFPRSSGRSELLLNQTVGRFSTLAIYGPYTNGLQLREALKIIRKIFPYRDQKCHVCGDPKNKSCKPCFNRQIGLCPGTCTGEVSKREYAKTVKHLKTFFSGRIDLLTRDLEKEMKSLARDRKFEEAGTLKNKIYALTHIQDVALIKDDSLRADSTEKAFRIESYDIAHMAGQNMVGVMTVVTGGIADKGSYRKFKIKGFDNANDVGALKEVLMRRLAHEEWPMPDLFVVDGGVASKNAFEEVLGEQKIGIPVLSVVKDERHQPKVVLGDQKLVEQYKKEILLSNHEAHRFATRYHKKLRTRKFLS